MRLIRLLVYAASAYLLFRIGFPEEGGTGVYHVITAPVLLGGALAVFLLLKVIDFGSRSIALGVELIFAVAVFFYLGFTMPQAKGRPPLLQMLDGEIPSRANARAGLSKLGLDPAGPAGVVTKLFPER